MSPPFLRGVVGLDLFSTDGGIGVHYGTAGAAIAPRHLLYALYCHLGTSGPDFADLVAENGYLTQWKCSVEKCLEAGLEFLRLIADRTLKYGAGIHGKNEITAGLTSWFPKTVWRDAIHKAGAQSWIDDSWYQTPQSVAAAGLWQSRCGAYVIGLASSQETLMTYENWHKDLRGIYAGEETAKAIAAKCDEVEYAAQQIGERLAEFSDTEDLPGHCKLETNG